MSDCIKESILGCQEIRISTGRNLKIILIKFACLIYYIEKSRDLFIVTQLISDRFANRNQTLTLNLPRRHMRL